MDIFRSWFNAREEAVGVVVLVETPPGVNASVELVPGWIPMFLRRSRRACSTAIWITTSGFALSMSSMIFCASITRSGVSRMTMAFCALICCTRRRSSNWRMLVTISVSSCGRTVFFR